MNILQVAEDYARLPIAELKKKFRSLNIGVPNSSPILTAGHYQFPVSMLDTNSSISVFEASLVPKTDDPYAFIVRDLTFINSQGDKRLFPTSEGSPSLVISSSSDLFGYNPKLKEINATGINSIFDLYNIYHELAHSFFVYGNDMQRSKLSVVHDIRFGEFKDYNLNREMLFRKVRSYLGSVAEVEYIFEKYTEEDISIILEEELVVIEVALQNIKDIICFLIKDVSEQELVFKKVFEYACLCFSEYFFAKINYVGKDPFDLYLESKAP